MTIDHIGAILYQDVEVLRITILSQEIEVLRTIGRLAFPLFAYLLVLGMENTQNVRNYFIRLFSFALISQIPFYLAIENEPFESLNIFFTLAAGLLCIYWFKKKSVFAMAPVIASLIIPFDYGVYGIATMGCMYILRENMKLGAVGFVLLNMLLLFPFNIQFLAIAALPLIILHNNGSLKMTKETKQDFKMPTWRKYFFYIYYPLHLTILYAIKINFNIT